jgi:hypothetical protein
MNDPRLQISIVMWLIFNQTYAGKKQRVGNFFRYDGEEEVNGIKKPPGDRGHRNIISDRSSTFFDCANLS